MVSAGYASSSILAFVFYFMFAKIMSAQDYGQFIYLFSISSVAVIVARFGLGQTTTVQLAKGNKEFVSQATAINLISAAILSLFLLLVNPFVAIMTFGSTIFMMETNILLGKGNYKRYLTISLANRISQIVLSLVLYYVLNIPGILLATAIVCIVSGPSFIRSTLGWNFKTNQIKEKFLSIMHNFGVESSQTITIWIDKLLLVPLLGFAVTGTYQFGFQILLGLGVIPMMIYTYLLPEESAGSSNRKVILGGFVVSIVLVAITFLASPLVIPHFFPAFKESVPAIQIMSFSTIPLTVTSIITAKLQSRESKLVGIGSIIRIASHLALIPILWNLAGMTGLALAVLVSILAHMFYLLIIYQKKKSTILH